MGIPVEQSGSLEEANTSAAKSITVIPRKRTMTCRQAAGIIYDTGNLTTSNLKSASKVKHSILRASSPLLNNFGRLTMNKAKPTRSIASFFGGGTPAGNGILDRKKLTVHLSRTKQDSEHHGITNGANQ